MNSLLKNGADPNVIGTNGTTPLEDACLKGFESVAAALLDHGALVNQFNSGSGETARMRQPPLAVLA